MSPSPCRAPRGLARSPVAQVGPVTLVYLVGLAIVVGASLSGCNWLTGPRSRDQPKQGIILKVDRHKAALHINDQAITLLSSEKPNVIGLEPGTYRVAIKKAGYFTRYFDVRVRAKRFEKLDARLPPELD